MRQFATVLLVLGGVAGCASQTVLEPAASAPLAKGRSDVAQASNGGVTVMAAGDEWKGDPENLDILYTPVHVRIENHSGKPVRISYPEFRLVGNSGFQYGALPPVNAAGVLDQGLVPVAVEPVAWRHDRFFVAPHVARFYPAYASWNGEFPYDPFFYNHNFDDWQENLPTQDMLTKALPEGVLMDGGTVEGFVYFNSVAGRDQSEQFALALADAHTGQAVADIDIPFVTKHQK